MADERGAGSGPSTTRAIRRPSAADATVNALLPEYLDALARDGKARHTIESSRLDLQQLGQFLGRQSVGSVAAEDVQAFFAWLARQQGNGVSSLRRKTSTIKQFFRQLHAEGAIQDDPSASISYPVAGVREDAAPLSAAELDAIVAATQHPIWLALLLVTIDAGLKRDEVVSLRVEDVALPPAVPAPGQLQIRQRRATTTVRHRTIPLTERLATALLPLVHERASQPDATVFDLSARGIDFVVETASRRAGVRPDEKVTPRMLRDGFGCARALGFMQLERAYQSEPAKLAVLRREHDRTLLRELGLSERSAVAARYRRLAGRFEPDRAEEV